jgi:acyl-CoA thioesterase
MAHGPPDVPTDPGTATPDVEHGPADRDLLGLELHGGGRSSFVLTSPLTRFDGKLYGGTAIAVAIAAAEAATGRRARWCTTQFTASADIGDVIACDAEVLAHGRRASQVRVTATLGGRTVFSALAATADPKPGGLTGTYRPMPQVTSFEDSEPYRVPAPAEVLPDEPSGFEQLIEIRTSRPLEKGPPGRMVFWTRARGAMATPAVLGFLADMVPVSIARAAGRAGGGMSLDNTLRIGPPAATDWVLAELEPHLATGGIGHGAAYLWSAEGGLLAVGSQTSSMLLFD